MVASEAASSWGPQPNAQPPPPIARAPNPVLVIHHAFAAKEESGVAVCLLPGTELAFERDVRCNRNWLSTKSAGFRVARFCSVEPDAPHQHHDALSFPDGNTVLVNLLSEGQYARVLQLPVVRREQDVRGEAEKADAAADLRFRPSRRRTWRIPDQARAQ